MNQNLKNKTIRAYHFTSSTLRDGRPIPDRGFWLKHDGEVIPCQSGLHASIHPFDALQYAPGNLLHMVELRGDIQKHNKDKVVAMERKIIKSIDAEKLMRDFARWNAMRVIHLWKEAPKVVLVHLKTGDETLRAAAMAAARDAARDAAMAAARDAAWAAAMAAAWAAARDAAMAAAMAAARDAVMAAARDAFIKKSRAKFAKMVNEAFKTA